MVTSTVKHSKQSQSEYLLRMYGVLGLLLTWSRSGLGIRIGLLKFFLGESGDDWDNFWEEFLGDGGWLVGN
jgi:hypothetical protein